MNSGKFPCIAPLTNICLFSLYKEKVKKQSVLTIHDLFYHVRLMSKSKPTNLSRTHSFRQWRRGWQWHLVTVVGAGWTSPISVQSPPCPATVYEMLKTGSWAQERKCFFRSFISCFSKVRRIILQGTDEPLAWLKSAGMQCYIQSASTGASISLEL